MLQLLSRSVLVFVRVTTNITSLIGIHCVGGLRSTTVRNHIVCILHVDAATQGATAGVASDEGVVAESVTRNADDSRVLCM